MDDQTINHLLTVLAQDKPITSPAILNNLVYYTPRTKSVPQLTRLINAIFQGTSRSEFNVLKLFEMSQAIVQWKLNISEPVIPPSEFYQVWNSCFRGCQSWTRSKLAILAGILSTRDNFKSLQASNFVDESGQIVKLYESWEQDIFIPTWCEFLKSSHRDPVSLVLIYAAISRPSDASRYSFLPWDLVTVHLSRLLLRHMEGPGRSEPFFGNNLSRMAKTLQTSLAESDRIVVSDFLSQVCRGGYDLGFLELYDRTQPKDYSGQYYSNLLFTVVLALNSILQTQSQVPVAWFVQMTMILFNFNFIAEDVGLVGFESYQSVYEITCKGITLAAEQEVYFDTLKIMNGNVSATHLNGNKINRAKTLFMLKFMGSTLSEISMIPIQFVKGFIEHLQALYLNSSEEDIRESAHIMSLSLFSCQNNYHEFLQWETQNYMPYIDLSTDQFLQQRISDKQIILIYQKMSSQLPTLQHVDRHLSRETLHYTYLRILNCHSQGSDKQAVLLKCLIYQILYSNEEYLIDWLDTTQELLSSIKFTEEQRQDILTTLWDVLSHSKSDIAFKWWYERLGTLQSRL